MSLAGLAVACAHAQNLDQTVDLARQAGSIQSVARALQVASGVPIVVKDVETVPVLVAVEKRPLREVLDKIAEVSDAQWTSANGTVTLFRSLPRSTKAKQEFQAAESAALKKSIDEFREQNKAAQDWSRDAVSKRVKEDLELRAKIAPQDNGRGESMTLMMSTSTQTPALAAMLEVLNLFPLAKVSELKPGNLAVFSTAPNRSQLPFPLDGNRVANAFIAANNALAAQAVDRQDSDRVIVETGFPIDAKKINRLGKILLRVERSENAATFRLILVAEDGTLAAQQTQFFAIQLPSPKPAELKLETQETTKERRDLLARFGQATQGFRLLSTSGATFEYAVEVRGMEAARSPQAAQLSPPAFRQLLSSPAANEPWSVLLDELLAASTKASETNLVASFDDSEFATVAGGLNQPKINAQALARALSEGGTEVKVADGWTVVKPQFAARAQEAQVARKALDDASKSLFRLGYPVLEVGTDYIRRAPVLESSQGLDVAWFRAIHTGTSSWRPESNWDWLRIYAGVNNSLRTRTANFLASALPSADRLLLWRKALEGSRGGFAMLNNAMMVTAEARPGNARNRPQPIANIEPTELYPEGIPNDLTLILTRSERLAAYGTKGGDIGGDFFPATSLVSGEPNGFDGWQMARMDQIQMRIASQRNLAAASGVLQNFAVTGGLVPFSGLANELKREIEQAAQNQRLQQQRQQRQNRGAGGGG